MYRKNATALWITSPTVQRRGWSSSPFEGHPSICESEPVEKTVCEPTGGVMPSLGAVDLGLRPRRAEAQRRRAREESALLSPSHRRGGRKRALRGAGEWRGSAQAEAAANQACPSLCVTVTLRVVFSASWLSSSPFARSGERRSPQSVSSSTNTFDQSPLLSANTPPGILEPGACKDQETSRKQERRTSTSRASFFCLLRVGLLVERTCDFFPART